MKLITNTLLLTILFTQIAFGQTHVNREWVESTGEPLNLEWAKSIKGSDNRIIHVGNTFVPEEGANIFTSVYNNDGSLLWQSDYNSSNRNNDYATAVALDDHENLYVLGTTDNSSVSASS